MGDRTYQQVTIYACPPESEAAVATLLGEYRFTGRHDEPEDSLVLGATYAVEEALLGTLVYDLGPALVKVAPGITFYGWEDPYSEWLGQGYAYTPEAGVWRFDCGGLGEPVFSPAEVEAMLDMDPVARARALGKPWDRAAHEPWE